MICLLDEEMSFPDPRDGEPDGLFAVGGDLSVRRLLLAYSNGIFPWYAYRPEDNNEMLIDPQTKKPYIQWWCPMERFVIFPKEVHISHSMRQEMKKLDTGELSVSFSTAFEEVVERCSQESCGIDRENLEGAWLGEEMKEAYINLYKKGYAASVEVWDSDQQLIGGLYGVLLWNGFYGESMFSLRPNASKIALIALCQLLSNSDYVLIDCQFETPHLKSMGGRYISYDEYMKLIRNQ